MDTAVIVAVVSSLAAIASAVFTARSAGGASRKQTEADERTAMRQLEAGAYERARQVYEGALGRMQGEIDRQARQINNLQRQVSRLTRQVRDAGLVPVTSSEEEST